MRFEIFVWYRPIGFVEDDDFMPAGWEGDLLLSERFDFVSNDIDSSSPGVSEGDNLQEIQDKNLSSEALSSKTPSLYASPNS